MALGALTVAALPWWRPTDPLAGRAGLLTYAPSGLALALRDRIDPGARVASPQAWASWLEWAAPDARYLVDSRFELFPSPVWVDYAAIATGGADAVEPLDRWVVDLAIVPTNDIPPAGWSPVFGDDDGAIYVPPGSTGFR